MKFFVRTKVGCTTVTRVKTVPTYLVLTIALSTVACGNRSKRADKTVQDAAACEVSFETDASTTVERVTRRGDVEIATRYREGTAVATTTRERLKNQVVVETYRVGDEVIYVKTIRPTGDTLTIEEIDDTDQNGDPGSDGTIDLVVTITRDGDRELTKEIVRDGYPAISVITTYSDDKRSVTEERFSDGIKLERRIFTIENGRRTSADVDLGDDGLARDEGRQEFEAV